MTAALATPGREVGQAMHDLMADLFPLCRSITGPGLAETLERLRGLLPLVVHTVPSGTRVHDWVVPDEWTFREAWIRDPRGRRVVDARRSNLHVVSYSAPVHRMVSREELVRHCHTDAEHPDWVPYRTSYYERDWGFCLAHRDLAALPDGEYEVLVDADLAPGHLRYGEVVLPGETSDEILISAHVCHPSLANDNLSGIVVAAFAAAVLRGRAHRYTYRFLFAPGTIGAVAWLAGHADVVSRIAAGLVLTGVGNPGPLHYKKSRRGTARIDRAAAHVLRFRPDPGRVLPFRPDGYDERQYCSPGYDLPVGRLSRVPGGEYPEYHTSADDLSFVTPERLADALDAVLGILDVLERDRLYTSRQPWGEPQLARHGLGGVTDREAMSWVLNLADGRHGLLDVAERADLPFGAVEQAATTLRARGLLHDD